MANRNRWLAVVFAAHTALIFLFAFAYNWMYSRNADVFAVNSDIANAQQRRWQRLRDESQHSAEALLDFSRTLSPTYGAVTAEHKQGFERRAYALVKTEQFAYELTEHSEPIPKLLVYITTLTVHVRTPKGRLLTEWSLIDTSVEDYLVVRQDVQASFNSTLSDSNEQGRLK